MEGIGEIARAYIQASSGEVQNSAKAFFSSLDSDGDEKVSLREFLSFMENNGYRQMCNPQIFKDLDKDGDGSLDFWETMTLYYILKSGRPLCDICGKFIPGIFFSCFACYLLSTESSFNSCLSCYQNNDCKHNHNGHVLFVDNYMLLQFTREFAARGAATSNKSGGEIAVKVMKGTVQAADIAFKTLEIATNVASCTIM